MPGSFKYRKGRRSRFSGINIALPKSTILFFGLAFIFLVFSNMETVDSASTRGFQLPTSKSPLVLSNISAAVDIISGSLSDPGNSLSRINNFLASQDESSCNAVYDPSLMQKAIASIPQIADRVKGLSKTEQYKLCISKVRAAKSGSNRHL